MKNLQELNTVKLNHLLAITEDSKFFYETAAKNIDDINMKDSFTRFSHQRTFYAQQLRDLVKSMGETQGNYENTRGPLHRVWIDVKFAINSGIKDAVIDAFTACENNVINIYKEVLQDEYPSDSFRGIILSQLYGIQKALQTICNLGRKSCIVN